jgi:DNA modification methylase
MLAGCPEGGVVLDPFSGAATTGLVAVQHGRRYIGIELNPVYVELASRRFEETIKSGDGLNDVLFHNPSCEADLTGWSGGIFGTSR